MLSDGQPNSRHTYDDLAYIDSADVLFSFTGSIACGPSARGTGTYTFSPFTLKWTDRMPGAGPAPCEGGIAAYDPVTHRVLFHDLTAIFAYDNSTDRWSMLLDNVGI